MTTTKQKQEILQSLNSLDPAQSDKVLNYMKGLIQGNQKEDDYKALKRQAMKEISQALGQLPKLNSSF
jgi:hypothetical protein